MPNFEAKVFYGKCARCHAEMTDYDPYKQDNEYEQHCEPCANVLFRTNQGGPSFQFDSRGRLLVTEYKG